MSDIIDTLSGIEMLDLLADLSFGPESQPTHRRTNSFTNSIGRPSNKTTRKRKI